MNYCPNFNSQLFSLSVQRDLLSSGRSPGNILHGICSIVAPFISPFSRSSLKSINQCLGLKKTFYWIYIFFKIPCTMICFLTNKIIGHVLRWGSSNLFCGTVSEKISQFQALFIHEAIASEQVFLGSEIRKKTVLISYNFNVNGNG